MIIEIDDVTEVRVVLVALNAHREGLPIVMRNERDVVNALIERIEHHRETRLWLKDAAGRRS